MNKSNHGPRLVGIGECMLELSPAAGGCYAKGYAGDVFNSCYYFSALYAGCDVRFISAVGDDSLSEALLQHCRTLNITPVCTREAGKTPGLYLTHVDVAGERQFSYWRSDSPARRMISNLSSAQRDCILTADLILLSGITLSILDVEQRQTLRMLLTSARAEGAIVAFDPNYRPSLWEDIDAARHWIDTFYALSDVVFPGFDDERELFDIESPADILGRPPIATVPEVIVKAGSAGVLGRSRDELFKAPYARPAALRDTTAAGDAFNAAYLAARFRQYSPEAAAHYAAQLAAAVVAHPGAIVPVQDLPRVDQWDLTEQ